MHNMLPNTFVEKPSDVESAVKPPSEAEVQTSPNELKSLCRESPALIYDFCTIRNNCDILRAEAASPNLRCLYSTKACTIPAILRHVDQYVDGFSVASPAEACVVEQAVGVDRALHLTSPGIAAHWLDDLPCGSYVSFNSLSQVQRLHSAAVSRLSMGIRVNPGRTLVEDERYDVCRKYSKLGVPLAELPAFLKHRDRPDLDGIHFHNGCLGKSWMPVLETVREIASACEFMMSSFEWINLGGGVVWDDSTDFEPLNEAVQLLQTNYALSVFIEPGAGFINNAGYLVASVVDVFIRDGKHVAVLDTTVNHMPEVFEYQFEPDVVEHRDGAPYEYFLAGSSCLAGDVFGNYAFNGPLEIGSRVTFQNVGAYTIVKAHRFNGINLPTIYGLDEGGRLELIPDFTFDDFPARSGAPR
jgi:carboxynorspermidine decarboxylase